MSVFHIQDGLFTVRGLGTGEKVHLKKYMRGFPVLLVEEGELSAAIILDPQRMRMLAEHLSIWAEEIEPSAQAVTGGTEESK